MVNNYIILNVCILKCIEYVGTVGIVYDLRPPTLKMLLPPMLLLLKLL